MYQFTSAKKMASILLRQPDHYLLLNKGAAEWVLQKCESVLGASGAPEPLTEALRAQLLEIVVQMASSGLRCICLASRTLPLEDASRPADFFEDSANLDQHMTAMAIVGIKDPVRVEVPDAVTKCQKAGITVRMVTGDNIHTARHIARECGILTDGGIALEGPEFRKMPIQELLPKLPKLQVRGGGMAWRGVAPGCHGWLWAGCGSSWARWSAYACLCLSVGPGQLPAHVWCAERCPGCLNAPWFCSHRLVLAACCRCWRAHPLRTS